MGFDDILYLVVSCVLVIPIIVMAIDLVNSEMNTAVGDSGLNINATVNESIQESWTQNKNFWDQSLPAIFFIFAAISVGLTIFLSSHPFLLIAWVFFNMLILWLIDALLEVLAAVVASPLNTGAMATSISFMENDLAKAVIMINIILGIVLFGKRAIQG